MGFCNTNFSLYQVSQLIVFNFKSDIVCLAPSGKHFAPLSDKTF